MRIYVHHVTHWPTTHASIHLQHFKETRLPCVRDIDSFICSMSNSFATCLANSCAVWQGHLFAIYLIHLQCVEKIRLQYIRDIASFICSTSHSFAIRLILLQYVKETRLQHVRDTDSLLCNVSHSFAICHEPTTECDILQVNASRHGICPFFHWQHVRDVGLLSFFVAKWVMHTNKWITFRTNEWVAF